MDATLTAEKRTDRGKNQARRHRAAGRLPAVVYGPGSGGKAETAIPVTVDPKALSRILHSESGANTIITLQLDDGSVSVLVKDFLLQPVTHQLLHADFYRLAMDRKLTVTVPVSVRGEARGVKQQGGILDFVTREFEIEVLPADIPEHVELDVTNLAIGHSLFVRDITVPKAKVLNDPDTPVCTVVAPRTEEAPAPVEEVAPAEPELIRKPKAESEDEGEGESK